MNSIRNQRFQYGGVCLGFSSFLKEFHLTNLF